MNILRTIGAPTKPWAPRNGQLAWWPLNEGSGTSVADIIGGLTGTMSAEGWADGKFGSSMNFKNFRVPDAAALRGMAELSISAWIKRKASTNIKLCGYWHATSQHYIVREESQKMTFYTNTTSSVSQAFPDVISAGWHFVAFTYNGAAMNGYLDGVRVVGPTAQSGAINNGSTAAYLYVGAEYDGNINR